jgi:hypothetical protein
MRNIPTVYRGTNNRLTLSQRYPPADLDLSAYQDPKPDKRKKSGISHRESRATNNVAAKLVSGFFRCQSKVSKNLAQWNKKIVNVARTLSQSMSYLRSFIIYLLKYQI